MTQPDDEQDIQQQFAQLRAEMKRVMAEPGAASAARPADAALDFQRIEHGLEALRRDADQLRAWRTAPAAEPPVTADALAALRARTDEITGKLASAAQRNREAIDAMGRRLDELARRRPSRWPVAVAILLGSLAIAAAVLLSAPGRTEQLIDLFNATVFPPGPHAENEAPPPPEPPAPAPAKVEVAEAAPPAAPAPAPVPEPPPPPQVAEPPPPAAAAAAEPPAPVAAAVAEPPAPVAADPPVAEPPPAAAVAIAEPPAAAAEPPAPVVAPPAPVAAGPPPAADPPAARGRIVLRAKADSWVEVHNRQGGTLIARLLHAGDTWAVPDQPGLTLSTGNAGGLELLVDGKPAPSLGGTGDVRRDVPLDAALVRAGRYAADPAARPKPSAASR